jgi:hypothetical protein
MWYGVHANESAPDSVESRDASLDRPSPEVCRCDPRCGNGPDGLPVEMCSECGSGAQSRGSDGFSASQSAITELKQR